MSSEAEAFVTALDVACVVLPMILFSSTATVFYPVFWTKTATTVEIPPLPLTGMVLQCAIWLVFCGLSNIIPGIVPNAFGVAIGLVFFVLYEKSHRRKVYGRAWRRHLSGLAVMGVLVGLCAGFAVAWHGSGGGEGYAAEAIIAVFGWLGFSASVLFLAHPLVAMARVLLTNNVGAMGSVEMNVCAVVTGFAWFANAVFFPGVRWLANRVGQPGLRPGQRGRSVRAVEAAASGGGNSFRGAVRGEGAENGPLVAVGAAGGGRRGRKCLGRGMRKGGRRTRNGHGGCTDRGGAKDRESTGGTEQRVVNRSVGGSGGGRRDESHLIKPTI
mmetsp:Transcript_2838/g.6548  ORF Transcript_2838/g.6548 Transcript_2838/m.6548 type:complete len:328 (+) Transcript_2838:327-1310(+)